MSYTQANRTLAIESPLGEDVLLLKSFAGEEALSRLFRFKLQLLSENSSIPFEQITGQNINIRMKLTNGSERYWNGFISRFSQGARDRRFTLYHAEMVPWLWFLSRTADCRIFQHVTVPQLVEKIFREMGFSDYELDLRGAFTEREYCVQYRETSFN